MNIRQLTYFCAVVRVGSFSRAAGEQGVSVQAVSKAIGELEEELGEPLFLRGSTGSQPTTFGWILHPYALEAVEAFSKAERFAIEAARAAAERRSDADLTLVLVAPPFTSYERFCKNLSEFLTKHLGFRVAIELMFGSEALHGLRGGRFDGMITVGRFDDPQCDTVAVGTLPTSVFFSPSHPLAAKKFVTLEDLAPYPVISAPAVDDFNETILNLYLKNGLRSEVRLVTTEGKGTDPFIQNNAYAMGVGLKAFSVSGTAEIHSIDPEEMLPIPVCRVTIKDRRSDYLDQFDRFVRVKFPNMKSMFS